MHRVLAAALTFAAAAAGGRAQHVWTFDELTAKADLVVIASHISSQDTGRRRTHPELKGDVRAVEMRTELRVLQVLKGDPTGVVRTGATVALRHYMVIRQDRFNLGSVLRFGEPGHPYMLFLVREPDGVYEPVSGQIFPTDSVYLLDRSDTLPPPLPPALPNLSGTWVLINATDAPAETAPRVQVALNQKSFEVTATGGSLPASRTYSVGISGGMVFANGDRTEQSAFVRDGSLVVEWARYTASAARADESIWRSEVWSVGGDRLTIRVKQRSADRTVLDAILVYRRSG